jgi:hypothetical protein
MRGNKIPLLKYKKERTCTVKNQEAKCQLNQLAKRKVARSNCQFK